MTNRDEVRSCFVDALGVTHGMTPGEVEDVLAELADDKLFELDSKTAEFLLVYVETLVGRKLPCPADLREDQYATLGDLIDIVLKED